MANAYRDAALTNFRVWARRMEIGQYDLDKVAATLDANFPNSVLTGPLALVFFQRINAGHPQHLRRAAAYVAAKTLTGILREGISGNIPLLAAEIAGKLAENSSTQQECDSYVEVLPLCETEISGLIADAIAARQREKANPNLANMILQKVRRA